MSALSDLVGSARSDVLPGLLMSPFGVEAYAQAEFEFGRKHLEVVGAAAELVSDRIAEMMLRIANQAIADKQFTFGSTGFKVNAFSANNLPFLFWLTLQEKQPTLTRANAAKLIDRDNEAKISRAVLELMGYRLMPPVDEKKEGESQNPPTTPLTGTTSSPDSSKETSPIQKSGE